MATRVATLGPVYINPTDNLVVINLTVPASTIVYLPDDPTLGMSAQVKDGAGNSNTHSITVETLDGSLIDGSATYVINNAYQSNVFAWNGSQWNVI